MAHKFEENYQQALDCFGRATALDPTWEAPRKQDAALWQSLADVRALMDAKGKLKTKRFNQLVDSLDSAKGLGPYGGGSYAGPSGGAAVRLEEAAFGDLAEGLNAGKVALGRVICSVHSDETVPL